MQMNPENCIFSLKGMMSCKLILILSNLCPGVASSSMRENCQIVSNVSSLQ